MTRREGDFGLFGRRNRPQFTFTVDRGLYEFASELDMDGDETGGKHTIFRELAFARAWSKSIPSCRLSSLAWTVAAPARGTAPLK